MVLCAYYYSVYTGRFAVDIFDRDLGFPVRTEIRYCLVLPYFGQLPCQPVGQRDRHGHELLRFVARIADHKSLVSCADLVYLIVGELPCFEGLVHPLADIRRLFVYRSYYSAGVTVEAILRPRVADFLNCFPRDLWNVDIAVRCDLSRYYDKSGADKRLTCDSSHRVLFEDRVKDSV